MWRVISITCLSTLSTMVLMILWLVTVLDSLSHTQGLQTYHPLLDLFYLLMFFMYQAWIRTFYLYPNFVVPIMFLLSSHPLLLLWRIFERGTWLWKDRIRTESMNGWFMHHPLSSPLSPLPVWKHHFKNGIIGLVIRLKKYSNTLSRRLVFLFLPRYNMALMAMLVSVIKLISYLSKLHHFKVTLHLNLFTPMFGARPLFNLMMVLIIMLSL